MVSLSCWVRSIKSFPVDLYLLATLATRFYLDFLKFAINCFHVNFASKHRIDDWNLLFAVGIDSYSFEIRIFFHMYSYLKVTIHVTFPFKSQDWLIIYSSRKCNLFVNLFYFGSCAFACCAGASYFFTLSLAWIAGSPQYHHTLPHGHKPAALASTTFLRLSSWFRFATLTCAASTLAINFNILNEYCIYFFSTVDGFGEL